MRDEHDSIRLSTEHAAPRRSFTVDGVRWTVRLRAAYDRRRPDLIFESDMTVRRVREYPGNWHELTDDELFALSWST